MLSSLTEDGSRSQRLICVLAGSKSQAVATKEMAALYRECFPFSPAPRQRL